RKRSHHAPYRAEESDKRRDRSRRRKKIHSLFQTGQFGSRSPLHRALQSARRNSSTLFSCCIKNRNERGISQSLQGSADFRSTFAAPENLPERLGFAIDFAEQQGLGKDDAPRPNRNKEQNHQNKLGDRGRLADDLEHIWSVQFFLPHIK